MNILAIESSCDETAAAVVEDGVTIRSNVIASSAAMHAKYGGIVPEVAAREQLKVIIPTIDEALKQAKTDFASVDAIAITVGPGLIGSLLIGVETAKTIALTTGKPLIPVNHVLAHMYANFVQNEQNSSRAQSRDHIGKIEFPAISLVVSGGHTELFLMESPKKITWLGGTLDDAAGEAFDKTARLLGFENRGGPAIQESAARFQLDKSRFKTKLPRPLLHDGSLNFSFSGLKTAIWREWNKISDIDEEMTSAFAYEVQEAITDVLVAKTMHAAQKYAAKSIFISGGVAANLRLREKMQDAAEKKSVKLFIPPISLCTDNAVYIASYAFFRGASADWHTITAVPNLSVEIYL
ncbi:MAG: tRNA (adenosine(37)-N6)-threonylcarbamoyltransferase complex transferase subunit TsaD [Candidatus Gottesmanbacteria bacterium]|nr:tRNA (adenosine(37)-N6)-threonylcarbamoyltransferase complex transferase subunit TsaD [Candidatus Gottesmanbacteria bacterium]